MNIDLLLFDPYRSLHTAILISGSSQGLFNTALDLAECPEPERWVKARWDDSVQVETMSTLEVYAIDRDGLVLDIANAMSKAHVKIQSINARPINEGNCLTTLTLSVNSREHLENVVKILKKIPSVYHIERGAGR